MPRPLSSPHPNKILTICRETHPVLPRKLGFPHVHRALQTGPLMVLVIKAAETMVLEGTKGREPPAATESRGTGAMNRFRTGTSDGGVKGWGTRQYRA